MNLSTIAISIGFSRLRMIFMASLLGITALWSPLASSATEHSEGKDIGAWMTSFHKTRDYAKFDEFWRQTIEKKAFAAPPQVREMLVGFLSQVFRAKPSLLHGRVGAIEHFPENQRDAISLLLWLVDTPESQALLKTFGKTELLGSRPPPIQERKILKKSDVDFCLGWYYATGDRNALMPLVLLIEESSWSKAAQEPIYSAVNLRGVCRREIEVSEFIQERLQNSNLGKQAKDAFLFVLDEK